MSTKNDLTADDLAKIRQFDAAYGGILDIIEKSKQFKVGDFLILYTSDVAGEMCVKTNTYGAPVKYVVVHSDTRGIPFIKATSGTGKPIGPLFSCVGSSFDSYKRPGQQFRFELDPDFADSLLLQDEYDPNQLHKSKKDIWKAVTEHNKANKVPTDTLSITMTFIDTVKVGDTLWASNTGFYLVQDVKKMATKDFNATAKYRHKTSQRSPTITVLTVRDKKGRVFDITADFFWHKSLYKERPRSYKELNI